MSINIEYKFLRTASILLLISGLFILFYVILTFSQSTYLTLLISDSAINTTIGLLGVFYLSKAYITYLYLLVFICFILIDLLCAFYVYKGNKTFWGIAAIRSLLTSFHGVVVVVLAFKGVGIISVIQALVCFLYYGAIFTLLIISRKASASVIPTEG